MEQDSNFYAFVLEIRVQIGQQFKYSNWAAWYIMAIKCDSTDHR
jgi:hypothetical protein